MNILKKLFGRNDIHNTMPQVKFYKEAAAFGEHGRLLVTSPKHGLHDVEVPFVFVGVSKPGPLTLHQHSYICEQALEQGFVPLELRAYGTHHARVIDIKDEPELVAPAPARLRTGSTVAA